MSHEIQLPPQQRVNQFTHQLSQYEWHDEKNMNETMAALEGYAYGAFNNVPNVPEQYKRQAISAQNRDKAERAVSLGERLGIPTKLFALFEGTLNKPFAIKSSKFDWQVLPVEASRENVPAFVMRNLMAFRQQGIVFDNFAVAVPGDTSYLPASLALRQEASWAVRQAGHYGNIVAKRLSMETVRVGKGIATAAKIAAEVTADVAVKTASVAAKTTAGVAVGVVAVTDGAMEAFLKDPVFLGCYGQNPVYMVEVGRWE